MTDPITAAARATAERLAAEYGPGLAADVDAALHARGTAQRPGRYLDPVSGRQPDRRDATLTDHLLRPAENTRTLIRRRGPPCARRTPPTQRHQENDRITEIIINEII